MQLFDTHAHLQDARFDGDREAAAARVTGEGGYILDCATNLEDAARVTAFAEAHEGVYCAVGVHPHDADSFAPESLQALKDLIKRPKVRAVGEIGLDYHYDFSPREIQKEAFAAQLALARESGLPVVIHDREAHQDVLDIVRAQSKGALRGVMHCYSGSWELAQSYLDMGFYISFAGTVTFSNARKTAEIASRLPLERLLIETDCPYLAPVPYRGKRNEPAFVGFVARKIAELRGITTDAVAKAAFENACELFKTARSR